MKDKKTLKIASVIVAVLIAIFCITRILAAGGSHEDGEEWESTSWGYYITTEDGEVIYAKEEYTSKDGTYTSAEQVSSDLANNGIYYDELEGDGSIFCIEQGQQLPSRHDENEIRKMGTGDSLGSQYHNGNVVSGLNPNSTSGLNDKEEKALESESGDPDKALRGSYAYDHFKDGTYYSRSLKDSEGHINGTITTFATENDGSITWSDGTEELIDEYERISWEDAYVLANSDPMANTESNPAQLALWKLGKLNTGKTDVDSTDGNELYEKALLFGTYRQTKEEREKENGKSGPILVDGEQDYKYKFVFNEQGNYLIAGPIQIDYGDLTITSADEKTEVEVRQIEKITVLGTLADSDDLEDITEYVKFTDAEGNELENMNETVGTAEGEGAGKKFPKSNDEFYIKVDYNNPIYTKVVAINSLEVSFKELDVRAVGYKLSDIPVYYTEWKSNNIMYQKCTVTHTYEVETTKWDSNAFAGYDMFGNPKYGANVTVTETKTETETKGNHLKDDCSVGTTCSSHKNCSISVEHEDIEASPSEGVLLKGETDSSTNAQMLFLLHKAELYWRRYKLVILFGPENQNPPSGITPPPYTPDVPSQPPFTPTPTPSETPSPSHPTYIDIGGNVWVDDVLSKTDKLNGKYKEYGDNDYDRPNVKVTLKYSDNDQPVDVNDLPDWVQKIWREKKLENPTYTDENGNYMFYQLPMDKKYYVEFTYDGMMYTTTEFLSGGSVEGYKSNPNAEVYETNSKAEEQENDRTTFNNKFAEITGGTAISGGKTEGTAIDRNKEKRTILEYKTDKFNTKTLKSRLRTTDEEKDVEEDHATGKAKEDFEMTVRTSDKQLIYPFGEEEYTIWSTDKKNELEYLKHINLGLTRREKADLLITTDLKAGATTIKNQGKVSTYKSNVDESKLVEKDTDLTTGYVKQEIVATDYNWAQRIPDIYGIGLSEDAVRFTLGYELVKDQLNVYVLYKIHVTNQSDTTNYKAYAKVVDYFDDRLELVNSQNTDIDFIKTLFAKAGYVKNKEDIPNSFSWLEDGTEVEWKDEGIKDGYKKIRTANELKVGTTGDTVTINLILKVKQKENEHILYTGQENGTEDGIKNIAEIASYRIVDEKGNAAGLVDCDSAPENATPGKLETYEDDTDEAQIFQLQLDWSPSKISGYAWDDSKAVDGIKGTLENGINNVKVELIEYLPENGKTIVRPGLEIKRDGDGWKIEANRDEATKRTDSIDGKQGYYEFYAEAGNYAIKFTYGDQEMLIKNRKYNAQDYQATTYKPLSSDELLGNTKYIKAFATESELQGYLDNNSNYIIIPDEMDYEKFDEKPQQEYETTTYGTDYMERTKDKSTARDKADIRADIIGNTIDLTYEKANLLHKLGTDDDLTNYAAELEAYTKMESVSDYVSIPANNLVHKKDSNGIYINSELEIDLGLKERPKAAMRLKKEVSRIVVRTSDGVALIDTNDASKLSNVQQLNKIEETFINMDAIAMDGATIDIDYTITVTNDGEDDSLSNYEYVETDVAEFAGLIGTLKEYFGDEAITFEGKLPTKANVIYDYVNINLDFGEDENKDDDGKVRWVKVYDSDTEVDNLIKKDNGEYNLDKDVTKLLPRNQRKVSQVVKTADWVNENLTPEGEYTIPIHLGIILAEDTVGGDDDEAFTYKNCAEIIQIYSGAGRRDYDAVVGNYEPYNEEIIERDSSVTGTSIITPPLGENRIYYVITIISATIIIAGIVLIKKKVLKK